MRVVFGILRIAIAGAVIAAVIGQLQTSFAYWTSVGVTDLSSPVSHFFSFFTIESNLLTVAMGLVGAVILFTRRGADPDWFNYFRAAVTTYMFTTGLVYNLLLRGVELPQGATLEWSNEILHLIAPLYVVLDWLFAPGRSPIAAKRLWGVLVFPVLWIIYTLVRGPIVTDLVLGRNYWYPYPFLNPETSQNGYASVAFYVVLIALVIGVTAAGVLWVSRRKPHSTD